jgi:CDP-diacylglycerol--serine O-phosphatidyltransferase
VLKNIKSQLPNYLTLANAFCGLMIIISSFNLQFERVLIFSIAALGFDFLDGTVARLVKSTSQIGKELDSLADTVSFGAAPGFVLYNYYLNEGLEPIYCYVCLIIPLFAAYRLAKFNSAPQSNEYFSGLPTPAFSIACFALPLASEQTLAANSILTLPVFVVLFSVLGGFLMVSDIRMFSIKLGSKNKQLNFLRLSLIVVSLVLIGWLKFLGAFLCLPLYLILSLASQKQLK